MDLAQGAAATGVSDETTQQSQPQPKGRNAGDTPATTETERPRSLVDAVLAEQGVPEDVIETLRKRRTPKGELAPKGETPNAERPTPNAEEEESEEQGAEDEESEQEQETPEEETPPAQGAPEEEEPEGEIPQPPGDWPEDARAQVLDARKKLRTRTNELAEVVTIAQNLERENEQLKAQPPRAIAPTFQDPLPDVWDPKSLDESRVLWHETRDWAEDHPEGAEKGESGPDGKPIERDYTPEEIRKLRRTASRIVDIEVPKKEKWIQAAAVYAKQATEVYPELFKNNTEESHEAALILNQFPEIKRFPDFLLWIGRLVTGRKPNTGATGNNGKPLSPAARKIKAAPKFEPAPSASRGRSMENSGPRGGSVEQNDKQARDTYMKSDFSTKDRLAFIEAKLSRSGRTGRKAPVLA